MPRGPRLLILAALCGLVLPPPAQAQLSAPTGGVHGPRTVVAVPLQDPVPPAAADRAGQLWSDFLDLFGFGGSSFHFMWQHRSLQRGAVQQARDDFTWLMDIAGYKLKEIQSSVGVIPTLTLTFGQARELTEADRDYVERMLERHARRNPGPLSAIQRTIVRGVLDAGEIGGFAVEKVEVDLFPLPSVKFALAPVDAPLGLEASRIMRAIDRLNNRVQSMQTRTGGGMPMPIVPEPTTPQPASFDH